MNEALKGFTTRKKKGWSWVHAIYGCRLEVAGGVLQETLLLLLSVYQEKFLSYQDNTDI